MTDTPQNQAQAHTDQSSPRIVVDDPEDFSRTRQLRSIFDARDSFVQIRQESRKLLQKNEIDQSQKNERLCRALQDFVILIQPILENSAEGEVVLHEQIFESPNCCRLNQLPTKAELKEMDIPGQTMSVRKMHQVRKLQQKHGKEENLFTGIRWVGVHDLIDTTDLLAVPRRCGKLLVTPPRERLLVQAFQEITSVMGTVGLGVDAAEEKQTKIDNDLLKEVDEWRKQNVQ